MKDRSMNTRGWQVGMVLLVVLSCGMFVAVPPLIRLIWLDEERSWWVLLAWLPFVVTVIFLPDAYVYMIWAIYLVGGSISTLWLFRPLPEEV